MLRSLRTLLFSLGVAVGLPRILLTAWVLVTVPALVAVYPVYLEMDEALSPHPAAGLTLDLALDADFGRLHGPAVPLTGGSVFVLLSFVFLAGGVLVAAGSGRKLRYSEFLAESARLFMRNLRVVLVGVLICMVLFWAVGWLDRLIRDEWVYGWDPGAVSLFGWRTRFLSLEFALEALSWFWGFLFLCVVFVSKMAMARLAALDRRCATRAWFDALRTAIRSPIRTGVFVALWALVWMGVTYLFGEVTVYLLEVRGHLGWGLLAGQVCILWTLVVVLAAFVAAQRLALLEEPVTERPELGEPAQGENA